MHTYTLKKLWETPLKRTLWRTFRGKVALDLQAERPSFIATDDISHRKAMLRRFYLDNGEEADELLLNDCIRDFSFHNNGKELFIVGFVRDLYQIDMQKFALMKHFDKKIIPKYTNISTMANENTLMLANTSDLMGLELLSETIFKKKIKDCCYLYPEIEHNSVLCFSEWGEISRFDLAKKKFTTVVQVPTPFCQVQIAQNGTIILQGGEKETQSGVSSVAACDFVWIYSSINDKTPTKLEVKEGVHQIYMDKEAKTVYFCELNEVYQYDLHKKKPIAMIEIPENSRIHHIFTETKQILWDNYHATKEKPVLSLYQFE